MCQGDVEFLLKYGSEYHSLAQLASGHTRDAAKVTIRVSFLYSVSLMHVCPYIARGRVFLCHELVVHERTHECLPVDSKGE